METLQQLLDSSTAPVITAFLLGLLTAISPCPLATNIAAVGFIGRFYGKMQTLQRWMNWIVGVLFVIIGIYYCIIAFS